MPNLIPDCTKSELMAEAREFDQANPHIWELVQQLAANAKQAGYTHYAIGTIWEVIRHHVNVTTRSNIEAADFKMPNNHRAYYARKYNLNYPQDPKFLSENHLRSTGPIPVDRFGKPKDEDYSDWVAPR